MTSSDILKNPINFLYIFSNEKFESLVAKHISSKAATAIAQKRANQAKYVSIAYKGTNNYAKGVSEISNAIQKQYGYTPQAILNKLLAGETVAGKNWRKGIYGVGDGEVKLLVYKDNPDVIVDHTTGQLCNSNDDSVISGGQPIYANDSHGTYVSGFTYQVDGKSYTTHRDSRDSTFYANTYGNENGMYSARGAAITASDSSSVWENIATAMPFIEDLLNWLASILDNFFPITTANTVPSQREFVSDKQDISLSSFGIVGAALVGGYLLLKK